MLVQGRSKVKFLIDNWYEVDDDLKDQLWINITIFILNFMIYFISIDDHLFFWFNTNINSIM